MPKTLNRDDIIKYLLFSWASEYVEANLQGYETHESQLSPEGVAAKYGYEVLDTKLDDSGYCGVVFIKHDTKEILISHSGTSGVSLYAFGESLIKKDLSGIVSNISNAIYDLVTDGMEDIRLALGYETNQCKDALELFDTIRSTHEDYKIIQTGHSLGGYICQVLYYNHDIETHIFDAPGAKASLETTYGELKKFSHNYSSATDSIFRSNPIEYYYNSKNIINSTGERLVVEGNEEINVIPSFHEDFGIVDYPIDKENKILPLSITSFASLGVAQHMLEDMLLRLQNENITIYHESDWPSTRRDAYKSYLSSQYISIQFDRVHNELPEHLTEHKTQFHKFFHANYIEECIDKTGSFINVITTDDIDFSTLIQAYRDQLDNSTHEESWTEAVSGVSESTEEEKTDNPSNKESWIEVVLGVFQSGEGEETENNINSEDINIELAGATEETI